MFTSTGQAIHLGRQLGAGGAGTVYEIEGQPNLVAKRYHQPPSAEHVERLIALSQRSDERLTKIAAWPTDVLFDQPEGQAVGFLMPRVDGASEIHTLHSPKSRLQKFPDATWAFLIHTASNIARAVATVHEAGFVIGDVNPKNIFVTRQGTVALLDCDSFQFEGDGKIYRCEAGFPEYTPPELQGVTFRDVTRTPEHDAFGLAVVIFHLLFLGRHPFAGKFSGEGEMSLARAIAEGRFAYGNDSAARQMHTPPGVLPWRALPVAIAEQFERSFLTTERTAPREWIETLEAAAQTLTSCALHLGHRYAAGLAMCPWCEIEMQARVKLFNVTRKSEGQPSAFRLDEVWREIEQIQAPNLLEIARNEFQWVQVPSHASQQLAKRRADGFMLALLVAAAGGFATSYFGGFCAFVGLGWLVILAGHYCLKLEPRGVTLASHKPPPGKLADAIKQARDEAAARVRQLEQQWEWDVNGRFVAKRNELIQHREHYAQLETTQDDRLQQLEAAAWQDKLRVYLEQFEVQKSEVSGSLLTTYLRMNGIKTAADVTPERIKAMPLVTHAQRELLFEWRRQKGQLLRLEPDALVHPALRQRVVTETEAMRERLEAELRSGALYLRRLRNEVEAAQLAVRDELLSAKQALAQAETDFRAAGKRRSLTIPLIVLIVAGIVGGLVQQPNHGIVDIVPVIDTSQSEMNGKARAFFDEAMEYRKDQTYDRAITSLSDAQVADPESELIGDELSYTLFLAGQYERAIERAKSSPHFGDRYKPYKNLGLAYAAQGEWRKARNSFLMAIERKDLELLRDRTPLRREDLELRYLYTQALKEMGELPAAIKKQEALLLSLASDDPDLYRAVVDKMLYWLWAGKPAIAQQNLPRLRQQDEQWAILMEEIINQHPLELIPKKAVKTRRR